MKPWIVAFFVLQAAVMLFDEFYFHWRRGLPRWERIGHPIDTLSVLAVLGFSIYVEPTAKEIPTFALLTTISSFCVTKDEWIHAKLCGGFEHWAHAVLFLFHPILLLGAGWLWWTRERPILFLETALIGTFLVYQVTYWNFLWPNLKVER
ncbi:MAG: hypothetical protein A2428_12200 [Bdellovibrionales bacterium RIFOXYC1_FULL_54_43]|nr:MAG: hypothetical protein A2428_12200 [Bdellovibrionales bacterium RIFOXYC1_FULL_54_43]OFZ84344.1 MAG: hypothetical protein A2603_07510 [Bdellovibrionales bacterium RIFOXYD1_FULL_55_31]